MTFKNLPLTKCGLEVEITDSVDWENNRDNLKILDDKVTLVQYTLGEPYKDDTREILTEIKKKDNTLGISSDEEIEL